MPTAKKTAAAKKAATPTPTEAKRVTKTPRQRATEALEVEMRKYARVTKKIDPARAALAELEKERAALLAQVNYLAVNPALTSEDRQNILGDLAQEIPPGTITAGMLKAQTVTESQLGATDPNATDADES